MNCASRLLSNRAEFSTSRASDRVIPESTLPRWLNNRAEVPSNYFFFFFSPENFLGKKENRVVRAIERPVSREFNRAKRYFSTKDAHLVSFANCLTQLRASRELVQPRARCMSPPGGNRVAWEDGRDGIRFTNTFRSPVRRDRVIGDLT